ncbi:MAG TPA: hypothetical protein PLB89_05955 [Flavobacteriales bacterium]|nr:hypothetical protein [Flavobacteriales bacterium]
MSGERRLLLAIGGVLVVLFVIMIWPKDGKVNYYMPPPKGPVSPAEQATLDSMKAANRAQVDAMVDEAMAKEKCDGVDLAIAAEQYVKAQLKSPATAEFSGYQDNMVQFENDEYSYLGYVDSQNGFGALLRMHFKVWMSCDGEKITVLRHVFE